MTRWAGTLFVLLLAGAAPLLAPPALLDAGAWPDVAVLAVVLLGFRGTPDRAALLGVALGFLAGLWSPEPLLFRPFLLGSVGFLSGQVASVLHREQWGVPMACAALGVLAVRAAETVAALLADGGAQWTAAEAARTARSAALAAAVAALAAPLWFAAARRWRLVAPLERSFRDV